MRALLLTALLGGSLSVFGQTTITLSADTLLTETWVIDENTTVMGNGFAVRCEGCNPIIRVENGASADFQDVVFPRPYEGFISVSGEDGTRARWSNSMMEGSIRWSSGEPDR